MFGERACLYFVPTVFSQFFYSFVSVTDRFIGELGPVALGQVPKDLDMKYENLVKGIKHIKIKARSGYL